MTEQWERWNADRQELQGSICITTVIDKQTCLIIQIEQTGNTIKSYQLIFNGRVYAYRCFEETAWLSYLSELDAEYGKDFHSDWSIYFIKNSRYIKQVVDQSYGVLHECELIHLAIISEDLICEVITSESPLIYMEDKETVHLS